MSSIYRQLGRNAAGDHCRKCRSDADNLIYFLIRNDPGPLCKPCYIEWTGVCRNHYDSISQNYPPSDEERRVGYEKEDERMRTVIRPHVDAYMASLEKKPTIWQKFKSLF